MGDSHSQEGRSLNHHSAVLTKPRPGKASARSTAALNISERTLNGLKEVFRMLADESRLKILLALASKGEMHVSALCELLDQSQPAVSHHLTLLRMAGLVGYRRDGKHNYYHVDSGLVRDLLEQFFADSGTGSQLQFEDFSLAFKKR